MKLSIIAPALILQLAATPLAWTQDPDRSILSFESTQFALSWARKDGKPQARIRCAVADGEEVSAACRVLDSLDVALANPELAGARTESRSSYVSLMSADQYGGMWLVFFDPGERTTVKADFPGYSYRTSALGKAFDIRAATREEASAGKPKQVGQGLEILNKIRVSGYDRQSPVYRGQW